MNTYGRFKTFLAEAFEPLNIKTPIYPGPELPDVPDDYVVLTNYGGPGMILDGAADDRSWQVRCVGRQNDYESAEDLANVIDIALISHFSSFVGGVWVSEIRRAGGAPAALMTDDADRTHFVCSYVASVELALPH